MCKIELIQETDSDNKVSYVTEINGVQQTDSASFDLERATKLYDFIVASNSKKSKRVILKTIEF